MGDPAPKPHTSYADYLAAERASDVKHEYWGGEVVPMAGGTPEHAALAAAVITQLSLALRGRPCRVYSADLRVRARETDAAFYPDVTVVCGRLETDPDDPGSASNPTLVVEVLSPTTEANDRGAKAGHYRRIPSLREYVLVAQDAPRIEVFRRREAGHWDFVEAGPGESLELESLGCRLAVDDVFANPLV